MGTPTSTASGTATSTSNPSGSIDARIVTFDPDQGTFEPGDAVTATVWVENTGDQRHTFFVGFSARGPNGNYHYNEGETGESISLAPGERGAVTVVWQIGDNAPDGRYDAVTIVWQEQRSEGLETELDREMTRGAFRISDSTSTGTETPTDSQTPTETEMSTATETPTATRTETETQTSTSTSTETTTSTDTTTSTSTETTTTNTSTSTDTDTGTNSSTVLDDAWDILGFGG
jgi:hypothetical protein